MDASLASMIFEALKVAQYITKSVHAGLVESSVMSRNPLVYVASDPTRSVKVIQPDRA